MPKVERYDLKGSAGKGVIGVDDICLDELEAYVEKVEVERDELRKALLEKSASELTDYYTEQLKKEGE